MNEELFSLFAARKGHFRFESNHHGELWLDLELLCLRPATVQRFAMALARQLAQLKIDVVCSPLIEGAFVGLMVAAELKLEFSYAERSPMPQTDSLYPATYRIPPALRGKVQGKRIAIVNDVINAGSAVRGTFHDLESCGAETVAIGALLILGTSAMTFAADKRVVLESIASMPNQLWTPQDCPLCASGVPLENVAGASCPSQPG
jgi:orotate phosphoribosyltransferase